MKDKTSDKNMELFQKANDYLIYVTKRPQVVMEKGEGVYIWDADGNEYLDFVGGWAVTSLGHCPECVHKALMEQSVKLVTASPSYVNRPMVDLAELLVNNSCFEKVWFGSSGAEANEAAIKFARKFGSKHKNGAYEIITTLNSFHGRTLTTMSASGKEAFKDLFEPKTPGFIKVPFNDIKAVEAAITEKTVAVMIEPIQGESGVIVADDKYFRELRRLCDKMGLLLIFDEIQTGVGRTGSMFYYEQCGIEPDVMTIAKGIGGGYPLSAILVKDRHCSFETGDHGGTFGGQPLATAVGLAVIREMLEKNICGHAAKMGDYLKMRLGEIASRCGLSNIRGKGLLIGVDLNNGIGETLVTKCMEAGLLINSPRPSILRFMPALTVQEGHIDKMISILKKSIDALI
jgi:acetylornithine/N-succinyldiaminopimelate aminotransferase